MAKGLKVTSQVKGGGRATQHSEAKDKRVGTAVKVEGPMLKRTIIGAFVLVLGCGSVVQAQTGPPGGSPGGFAGPPPTILYTPPLSYSQVLDAPGGGVTFACRIANVTKADRTVRIQIIGGPFVSVQQDSGDIVLAAGMTKSVSLGLGEYNGFPEHRCEFTVNGSANAVRAVGTIAESAWRSDDNSVLRDIVAVQAS